MKRRIRIEESIPVPQTGREKAWENKEAPLGQIVLHFEEHEVNRIVHRISPLAIREECSHRGNLELVMYQLVSWQDRNQAKLRSVCRIPILHNWPVPKRQTMVKTVVQGPVYPLVPDVQMFAVRQDEEVLFFHEEKGEKRIHYAVAVGLFHQGVVEGPPVADRPVQLEPERALFLSQFEIEVWQALPNFEQTPSRTGLGLQTAARLDAVMPHFLDPDLPGPEAIQMLAAVPVSMASMLPRLAGFYLTASAQVAARRVLAHPASYKSPVDGQISRVVDLPDHKRIHIVGDDDSQHVLVVEPTFEVDEGFSEDGVTVRKGQTIGYSWSPHLDAGSPLSRDLVVAAFARLWESKDFMDGYWLIRLDFIPPELYGLVIGRQNKQLMLYWRVTSPLVRITMDHVDRLVDCGCFVLDIRSPDKTQHAKK